MTASPEQLALVSDMGHRVFATVDEALEQLREGRPIVTVDRSLARLRSSAPGHVTVAASSVSGEVVNFMATHARGLIYLSLTSERCDALGILPMAVRRPSPRAAEVMVTVEARYGVTTGISAWDRAHTISVAIDAASGPDSLVAPGHVMPLRVKARGVLERPEPPEAAVDLARLAGRAPAGVICAVMTSDGEMAEVEDLIAFAREHGLYLLDIEALVEYRRRVERRRRLGLAPGDGR